MTGPVWLAEQEVPGEQLHIDTKKLGHIGRSGNRVTGNRRESLNSAGWEAWFVAIDDRARRAFAAMYPVEKQALRLSSHRGPPRVAGREDPRRCSYCGALACAETAGSPQTWLSVTASPGRSSSDQQHSQAIH